MRGENPPALLTKPELNYEISLCLDIFRLLYRGEAISVSDIMLAAQLMGSPPLQKTLLIVKTMEAEAMRFQNKKTEAEMKAAKSKTMRGRGQIGRRAR